MTMSDTISELLPCPFCGSSDINTTGPCYDQFMCNGCGVSQYDQPGHAKAIAAWNTRSSAGAVKAEPVWGYAETVGNLIAQLSTMPPDMPIYGAFHADTSDGRKCMVRGLTISRERVDGRKIETGNDAVPYSAVAWSAPQEPLTPAYTPNAEQVTDEMVERAHDAFYATESSNSRNMMRSALEAVSDGLRKDQLRDALSGLLDHYVSLINSGDAGSWDPETDTVVIAARAALSGAK